MQLQNTEGYTGLYENLPAISTDIKDCLYKPPTPSTEPEQVAREKILKSYIGRTLRILLKDNRTFVGNMYALDNYCNIILNDTYRLKGSDENYKKLGVVYIEKQYIVKIELMKQ